MMQSPASAAPPKVELCHVDLRYFGRTGEAEALEDISLAVSQGEFVAIIGQSGCGKSTLLSLISGILQPTGGVRAGRLSCLGTGKTQRWESLERAA